VRAAQAEAWRPASQRADDHRTSAVEGTTCPAGRRAATPARPHADKQTALNFDHANALIAGTGKHSSRSPLAADAHEQAILDAGRPIRLRPSRGTPPGYCHPTVEIIEE